MNPQYFSPTKALTTCANCPACEDLITILVMTDPGTTEPSSQGIFVYPSPTSSRQPIKESNFTNQAAVYRAYQSAVKAFNVGLWDACLTSCRKTLEGIVKTEGSSTHRTLFGQLEDFFTGQDLSAPLIHLTHTLRQGGNIGAHFDLEREPDQQVAKMMLDLIEFFLEFIYILPNQSAELERRIGDLSDAPSSSESNDQ